MELLIDTLNRSTINFIVVDLISTAIFTSGWNASINFDSLSFYDLLHLSYVSQQFKTVFRKEKGFF
jgi:hypothetical protein